jgi:hypothetical protein
VKVNPKTLRVKFDLEWMNALNALDITKVPYNALSQKCKEMGLTLGVMAFGPIQRNHQRSPTPMFWRMWE